MAGLKLSHIYKVYDNGVKAVNDFNIDIKDKEFIVFVGPSGCGKSTTLRMIAGLEDITAGDLLIGDTICNDLEPKDRDIAMVFQNYALYPHMTVYDNMAFGLRNRHMSKDEIHRRVMEAAKILDIEEYLERKPKAMSGGQRQRVALGRAIVRDPKVFLLDEPLSNLDAKLRAQMRTEITKLHKRLGTTFIYVTHDQVEAMTMGTRIVVMKKGFVQQIDTPLNLYDHPGNKFVAGFIGTPQMNFFTATLLRDGDKVKVTLDDQNSFEIDYDTVGKMDSSYLNGDKKVYLGIRPDHIKVVKKGIKAIVNVIERLGTETLVYANLEEEKENSLQQSSDKQIIIKVAPEADYELDKPINIEFIEEKIHFFDLETELSILPFAPEENKVEIEATGKGISLFDKEVKLPKVFDTINKAKGKFSLGVSPDAIVEGKEFTLKVAKVEDAGVYVDEKGESKARKLAHLAYQNRKVYAYVNGDVKAGEDYSFDLCYEKISIYSIDEEVFKPISEVQSLIGTFVKQKEKEDNKSVVNFYYNIEGTKLPVPLEKVIKITTIENDVCYRKKYKYVFSHNNINQENVFKGEVLEVLDYGKIKYAKVRVGEQELLIKVDVKFDAKEIEFGIDVEAIEVYQQEIDMRIC